MAGGFVEHSDRWTLPVATMTVDQCRVDHAFTFVLGAPGRWCELRVEVTFTVSTSGSARDVIDPEADAAGLVPALSTLHREVEELTAFKDGRLALRLADGSVIEVDPSAETEAWTVVGSDGLQVVSMPGGELAVWFRGTMRRRRGRREPRR